MAKALFLIKSLLRALLDVAKIGEPENELDGEHLKAACEGYGWEVVEILSRVYDSFIC